MLGLLKTYKVTILDNKWEVIRDDLRVKCVPRKDELIYLPEHNKYFLVLNVVYNFTGKQEIFIVVDSYTNEIKNIKKID